MIKPSILGRDAVAVLVSLLAVGTVFAMSPAPTSLTGSSHALGAQPVQTADKTPEPTESPASAVTPEAGATAEHAGPAEPPASSATAEA